MSFFRFFVQSCLHGGGRESGKVFFWSSGPGRESISQSLHDIRLVRNTFPPAPSLCDGPVQLRKPVKNFFLVYRFPGFIPLAVPGGKVFLSRFTIQGAGRKQVFHQANIVERLKNLFSLGPACRNQTKRHSQKYLLIESFHDAPSNPR